MLMKLIPEVDFIKILQAAFLSVDLLAYSVMAKFIGKVEAVLCRHICNLRQRVGEIDPSKKTEQKVTNKQRKKKQAKKQTNKQANKETNKQTNKERKNKRALVTVCRARYYANVPGGIRINVRKGLTCMDGFIFCLR